MASDPYKYFRVEAHELVDQLGKGLLDLEQRADAELVARLLRFAHTLKGAARIVKHRELAELAHAIEDALAPLREAPGPQRLDAALALVDRMTVHVAALPGPNPAPPEAAQPAPARVDPAPATAAASPPRFDTAVIGEALAGLAEAQLVLNRLRGRPDPQTVAAYVEQLDRALAAVRHDVERLRLMPVAAMFTSLERTARDAALACGKRVELSGAGGDVRLDARVLNILHGALVQLVRNAVVHGLELPADRTAAGKPPAGRIAIAFALRGNRIEVTCADDGRGLDIEAIRRAAVGRGFAAERARELDDEQLVRLLLRGGITTASRVSELAGRGIGLDVVREAAHQLGGEVTARTVPGRGVTIALTVPTSLAAVSALSVEVGDRIVAIPQAAIRRVVRIAGGDVVRGSHGMSVAYDDVAIPFASLAQLIGAGASAARGDTMVVVEGDRGLAGLGVDRTVGIEDVVVGTLPATVPVDPIVWGIALDGEGRSRLVVEPNALVAAVTLAPVEVPAAASRSLPILVVDDSLTTRMLEQSILESAGYVVELASSAEEALERVSQRTYGLLLVDVEMPGMDGFALISELRARRELATLPAILVTSRNTPDDHRRGASVGAQGYVVKSEFDQVELLAMIRRLVRA